MGCGEYGEKFEIRNSKFEGIPKFELRRVLMLFLLFRVSNFEFRIWRPGVIKGGRDDSHVLPRRPILRTESNWDDVEVVPGGELGLALTRVHLCRPMG